MRHMGVRDRQVDQVQSEAGQRMTTVEGLEPVPAREPGQTFEAEPMELATLLVDKLVNEARVDL